MVLAETGEDVIATCTACDFASNIERASVTAPKDAPAGTPAGAKSIVTEQPVEIPTPGAHTVEEVAAFLKLPAKRIVKTLIFIADGKPVAVLCRGDREINPIKVKEFLDVVTLEMASAEAVEKATRAPVGFAGPVGLAAEVTIIADHELITGNNWVVGANKADTHLINIDLERDCSAIRYADLRFITASDPCPLCGKKIELYRGIEVGHVFKLGTKYSEAMGCVFLDEDGKEKTMIMGCYGIGVSRVVAASIEQNNDADGIKFPPPIAPFEVMLLCLDPDKPEILQKAEKIYAFLGSNGIDVLLDDREERPGAKFKDADLLGSPMQLIVGGKGVARGIIEAKDRRTGEKTELPLDGFEDAFKTWRDRVHEGWSNEER
jgi:prolyl-tRNA synthetase